MATRMKVEGKEWRERCLSPRGAKKTIQDSVLCRVKTIWNIKDSGGELVFFTYPCQYFLLSLFLSRGMFVPMM